MVGLDWTAAAGWESTLADLIALIADGGLERATVIKRGEHRAVYRVEVGGQTLFVKCYPCRGWRRRLRHALRASSARREWHKAREVARRGVATITPVAWGEERRWGLAGDCCLVTAAIAGARALDQYILQELPNRMTPANSRRRLIDELARFVAAVHQAGIEHNDFHAGNVLVEDGTSESPRFSLIDLPGVRLGRALAWRRSRDSLAMFASSLWRLVSPRERWRFWRVYLRERENLHVDPRAAAGEVFHRARSHARRILRGRDDRALRTNRDFLHLSQPAGTAHLVRDLPVDIVTRLWTDPDEPIRRFRHAPVKLGHAAVTVIARLTVPAARQPLTGTPAGASPFGSSARHPPLPANAVSNHNESSETTDSVLVAYKRSRPGGWWKALLGRFRRSRAIEGWRRGHALLQRGIATPRPLLALESRHASRRGDSHLAVEWIVGAENLHLFGWRLAGVPAGERMCRVRQAATALGTLIGRMHDSRISHRDLKGTNLILLERDTGVDALVVDLDGLRIRRRLGSRERVDNLARMAVSLAMHAWVTRGDRLRFLRDYVGELQEDNGDWKSLWRAVARREQRLLHQKRQAGEQVA